MSDVSKFLLSEYAVPSFVKSIGEVPELAEWA